MIENYSDNNVFEFFRLMSENGINYVSWKNNHEIEKFIKKGSDLDIYIPIRYKNQFLYMASKNGWISVFNPVAKFKSIEHFYHLGLNGRLYHLHVYFEIITGESWIKEFRFPIGDFLINNRCKHKEFDLYVLDDKSQAYLFALRHLLKSASIVSRLVYLQDFDSYRSEWQLCNFDVNKLRGYGPILLDDRIDRSGLQAEFRLSSYINSVIFRFEIKSYLRINYFLLPLYRVRSFIVRLYNKIITKRKKLLKNRGVVLAISGVDGAGKTSMVDMLDLTFSRFLTVKRLSLGKPQGRILESIRKSIYGERRYNSVTQGKNGIRTIGFLRIVSSLALALLRVIESNKAKYYAGKGYIVVVDRWPTKERGKMDGPKIHVNKSSNIFIRALSRFEGSIYELMPAADVCLFLDVPVETAIKRNSMRAKGDKETDIEIHQRHAENLGIKPISEKFIRFDNNGLLEEKTKELQFLVCNELASYNR